MILNRKAREVLASVPADQREQMFVKFKLQGTSRTMESSFEETKPYVLTELGRQFVHYVIEDVVNQISGGTSQP
jgi:hypothetical protein